MKKIITFICLIGIFVNCIAQSTGLQDNLNVKLGLIGGWLGYEKSIGDKFLADIEFGYTGGILNGDFVFTTTIEIEPRFYYNIDKRIKNGKSIVHNSANYLSLQMAYFPDLFTSTTASNGIEIYKTLNIIPTYGFRRNISGRLNFDFEIGIGYQIVEDIENDFVANLTLALTWMCWSKWTTYARWKSAVLGVAGSLLPSVASLALITIPINEAKVAFNRMYEFASMEREKKGSIKINDFNSLEIKNLTFRFAGRSQLLKNITIEANKNECIAIVGESGSGKSTLGQIIQKFYPFENGRIIINNKNNLSDIATEDWRNILGVVPQDVTIFGWNIITNILLGQKDKPENIVKFCQDYGFEDFINSLPQSYATILGEEGINLSGGQKQVIALIRALYKKPKVLLLDEFTSAMNRKTEQFVLELLNKLKSEITIIFISHRLHSLPKIADRIYVLENGVIANFGNHKKLMESNNFYSAFWTQLKVS